MRIAIPVEDGQLSWHFGHCSEFAILETDAPGRQIVRSSTHRPPPHEPGVIPVWLAEQGAAVAITGRQKSLPGAEAIAEGFRANGHQAIAVAAQCPSPNRTTKSTRSTHLTSRSLAW